MSGSVTSRATGAFVRDEGEFVRLGSGSKLLSKRGENTAHDVKGRLGGSGLISHGDTFGERPFYFVRHVLFQLVKPIARLVAMRETQPSERSLKRLHQAEAERAHQGGVAGK